MENKRIKEVVMPQEVRGQKKKLFEWDKDNCILSLVKKDTHYLCELADDFSFVCIAEKPKTREPP